MEHQQSITALTNLTIGGQSVIYEIFHKHLDCKDAIIRKPELTYFSAAITTAVYLRLGKQPNRETILDEFAKIMLEGSIPHAREQISFGAAVAQYQRRYAEYDGLSLLLIDKEKSSSGDPATTLLLHLYECVTEQIARDRMLKIAVLSPLIERYVLDHIEFVQTKM